jgi:NADH dehydrogenase FAD-containing subunit
VKGEEGQPPRRSGSGRLLLLGGDHVHLFVLDALARRRIVAGDVTVVAPHALQVYSSMVPGYLVGRYTLEDVTIDLRALTRRVGGQFREAAVERLDAAVRRVLLDDATSLPYDVASVAIGAVAAGLNVPGARAHARFIETANQVRELPETLDRAAESAGPEPLQIVVVGAGPAGVEVALAVRARLDRLGANRAIISLLDSSHTVLRDRSPAAQEEAARVLRRGEITLRLSTAVEEVGPNHVRVTGGRVISADVVIWTSGIDAPPVFRASGLPTDSRGFLMVDDHLAIAGCPGLFGAGDAVSLTSHPRTPKAGVYAARQGPVLAHNLGIALGGAEADRRRGAPVARFYTPPRRSLALLNTGDGRAIFCYAKFATTAGWAMTLKHLFDRRFLRRFQRLETGTPRRAAS